MPSITTKELADAERNLVFLCFPERTAVWDAVAGYVQEQLLLHKGVRIPTLGSFDAVPQWIQAGNEAVIIQRPVFRLARNLAVVHNLMDDKDYLPGDKELEPLKYAKVATDASVSRRKVEGCILGVTSLLSHCLGKGANVALVLRNVGVLLIEGRRVEMKFYYDFLETLSGKKNLAKAVFKVPWLLDMLVSRVAPVASLSVSGRVILFPEFETELVAEPLPRPLLKTSRRVPGGDKQMRREGLPHLGQGTKVGFPGFPFPASPSSRNDEIPPFWEIRGKRRRRSSRVRQRRVIPGGSSGKKQPATGQPKGKPAPTGQAPRQSRAQAAELQSYGGGGGGGGLVEKILAEIATTQTAKAKPSHAQEVATFVTPVIAVLSVTSSEASLREEPAYEVLRQPLPRPRWRKL
ncbi:uncharacterized protein LOC143173384 [Aptenodytes patagonicus]|uniref:uncharacterized protein LOC143173384 n=1 Tax=Aptenodytes patagonicus TaxID=9234 RepID=UPI003F9FCC96